MLKNIKKYLPKKTYKERSQPEERKRLGLLEKKQDYKIRAEDHHTKEKKFKGLVEKARGKNPDEFYFQMNNSKIVNGENLTLDQEDKSDKLKSRLSHHQKMLNLVNQKRSVLMKKNEKLEIDFQGIHSNLKNNKEEKNRKLKSKKEKDLNDLALNEDEENEVNEKENDSKNLNTKRFQHKIFFDSIEEMENFNPETYFDSKLVGNTSNRIKNSQLERFNFNNENLNEDEIEQRKKEKKRHLRELIQTREKLSSLNKISSALEYQKHIIKPGKKRKIEGKEGIYNYRFFNERKK